MENLILCTDSYKMSHWKQYPPGTTKVKSYLEARGGPFKNILTFGALNYYVTNFLEKVVETWMIEEAEALIEAHMGPGIFNRPGWEYIQEHYGGVLPLEVWAAEEGLHVPPGNVLLTIQNTDPRVPWLTSYVETALYPWYPYTVATLAYHCRQVIEGYLKRTGDPALVPWKLHDFGYRGASSEESAMLGGMAHLVSFQGTDTLAAVRGAQRYYHAPLNVGLAIPAAEHSTITSWGRDYEVDAFQNLLYQFPTGPVAVVSDSWNVYAACEHLWGEVLRDQVLARDGVLIIRPDSGDPPEVVQKCLDILGSRFGFTVNQKGFKVLHEKVRLIQGDGVDPAMIDKVLGGMEVNGWSTDNIAFGMGGALLQKVNRDTCGFAMKCCMIVQDGKQVPVWKHPMTDTGKRSKSGDLVLGYDGTSYFTLPRGAFPKEQECLKRLWRNGEADTGFAETTFTQIRQRAGTL